MSSVSRTQLLFSNRPDTLIFDIINISFLCVGWVAPCPCAEAGYPSMERFSEVRWSFLGSSVDCSVELLGSSVNVPRKFGRMFLGTNIKIKHGSQRCRCGLLAVTYSRGNCRALWHNQQRGYIPGTEILGQSTRPNSEKRMGTGSKDI